MSETRVVNKNTKGSRFILRNEVYIGRGSRWGNQWSHRPDTKASFLVETRERAVEQYRRWLWTEVRAERITLSDLASLRGKTLVCYCAPLLCHGDVLARAADWAADEIEQEGPA